MEEERKENLKKEKNKRKTEATRNVLDISSVLCLEVEQQCKNSKKEIKGNGQEEIMEDNGNRWK